MAVHPPFCLRIYFPSEHATHLLNRAAQPATSGCMLTWEFISQTKGWPVYLLQTLELTKNCRTVPAKVCTTPGHDGSIFRNGSKSMNCGPICCTPFSSSRLAELSPPKSELPQLTTDPSSRIAAKAPFVAGTCCTILR